MAAGLSNLLTPTEIPMITLRLAILAAACAASTALAQTAAPAAGAPAAGAPAAAQPGMTAPGAPGSTTNPSLGTVPGSTIGGTSPSLGSVPGATVTGTNPPLGTTGSTAISPTPGAGGIADSNSSAVAQAQQRRQLALQQCGALSGASRNDCTRTADDDFSRATSTEALAQQGQGSIVAGTVGSGAITGTPGQASSAVPGTTSGAVAGNIRSQPDVSPTSRDNNAR